VLKEILEPEEREESKAMKVLEENVVSQEPEVNTELKEKKESTVKKEKR